MVSRVALPRRETEDSIPLTPPVHPTLEPGGKGSHEIADHTPVERKSARELVVGVRSAPRVPDLPPQINPSLVSHPRNPESGHPDGIPPQPSRVAGMGDHYVCGKSVKIELGSNGGDREPNIRTDYPIGKIELTGYKEEVCILEPL
jgi:hypothetical protein